MFQYTRIGFVIILMALSTIASAQQRTVQTFSGIISDAVTQQPLPGASIYIADIRMGAIADTNGRFMFRNVPVGHHLLEVSHTGYANIVEHIDLTGNTTKNFILQPSIVENQGVVITGVSNATSIRKAPIPVTSIRKAELLQTPSTNIIDALAKEPGISQLSTGPGISKPIIRGLGSNRVVLINDGVRQEGQQWGDEHGIEIDDQSVSKVEIVKGPASIIYGSDALAGVINIITNAPVAEGTIRANILSNYQTNNNLFSIHSNVAGNIHGFNWNAYATSKSAGDYKNKADGKVLNSRFNDKAFGGYIGLNKSWGFSHLVFSKFEQNLGLVEGDRDDATGRFLLFAGTPLERLATVDDLNERKPFAPRQNITHTKVVLDNSVTGGGTRVKLNAGLQRSQRKEYGDPESDETELFFDLKTITYNMQVELPSINEWHTSLGVSGMYQVNKNKGEEVIIPEYDLFDVGVFAYVQRFFKKTTLSAGVRFDNRAIDSKEHLDGPDTRFNAFDKNFSNISASVGLTYEPADYLTVKANIARGFRAPNIAELASNGVHEGTNRYEYGEVNLKSETSTQADAGIQVDYEHFSLGINGFYNHVSDFIFYRRLLNASGGDSLVDVDGEMIEAFQFAQNNAHLTGLEMNLDIHPHPLDWLHFENSVSFVRGRFNEKIEGTDHMPLIPAPRWQSELRADIKRHKFFKNSYVRLGMDWTFSQNKPFFAYNTETATPAYTLWNAGIGSDITNAKGHTLFSIHLAGLNLTDAVYQNHLSRLKYTDVNNVNGRTGVFNAGRNFSLKVNIPILSKL